MHITDEQLLTELPNHGADEPLLAATYARVTTAASFTHWLTPIGNYLIARPAARSAAGSMTEQTGVPLDAAMVLGLSATSLHIWSADPMLDQVHDHLGRVPLDHITAITVEPGRSWQKTAISLADGHTLELEARGAAHALSAEFDRQRA